MIPFEEKLRFSYPLTKDSLVINIGGSDGVWARQIYDRYKCHVFVFEPMNDAYAVAKEKLKCLPTVHLFNSAIGAKSGKDTYYGPGDMAGKFNPNPVKYTQEVDVIGIMDLLADLSGPIALMELNCEGGEYEILETLLANNAATRFDNIQVQPHTVVPDYEARWKAIEEGLAKTHEITWGKEWTWFNFAKKNR